MAVAKEHLVTGNPMVSPFPKHLETVIFGMVCFWGTERRFWETPGVYATAVGYAGGDLRHPTYREVCSGNAEHVEVVLVVYDPAVISYEALLKIFWEGHNPTQGIRQGNDIGTQYRSVTFTSSDAQSAAAHESMQRCADHLSLSGFDAITTEIREAPTFYCAEDKHQQYLTKHPNGYCSAGGTGDTCTL